MQIMIRALFVESFGDSSGLWLPPGESAPKGCLDGQVWKGEHVEEKVLPNLDTGVCLA